jgi:hypothetical protein
MGMSTSFAEKEDEGVTDFKGGKERENGLAQLAPILLSPQADQSFHFYDNLYVFSSFANYTSNTYIY